MKIFRQFYADNRERLFGYLVRRTACSQLAADITQESFTRYLERYREREANPSLLFTIARNLLYDHSRKKKKETPYDEELHSDGVDPEKSCQVRQESRSLLAALRQLDEEERDLLALVVSSGLSYRDIADLTGNSVANVKVKIHRSRVKLKKILYQEEA